MIIEKKKKKESSFDVLVSGFVALWAFSGRGSAYKREDDGPERFLNNDFRMDRWALESCV